MKNKKQIFTTLLSVLVSVFLVTGAVFAVTTIGTKVSIGTGAGAAGAVSLSGAAGSDFGLQTYTQVDTNIAGWYAANNAYMTVSAAQTGNTSVFGSISELDLGRAGAPVNVGGSNYGGMWADLEIFGTTNIGASNPVTPVYSGAVIATIVSDGVFVVPANRYLAGVVVDSAMTAGYTNNGVVSGILIRKSSGKDVWPVGLRILDSTTTTGISVGTATTGIEVNGVFTNGISVTNSALVSGAYNSAIKSVSTLAAGGTSEGIAGYFEGHLAGVYNAKLLYGVGTWLNLDSTADVTGGSVRALDVGIWANDAAVTADDTQFYGINVDMHFDVSDAASAIYPLRFNTTQGGATPDGWFFAANHEAIASTPSAGTYSSADGYITVNIQGTNYRIPYFLGVD